MGRASLGDGCCSSLMHLVRRVVGLSEADGKSRSVMNQHPLHKRGEILLWISSFGGPDSTFGTLDLKSLGCVLPVSGLSALSRVAGPC